MNQQTEESIDARLEQRTKALLDESVDRLDARTRSKLTQARHAALAELQQSRGTLAWRRLAPAAALVAIAVVMIVAIPVGERSAPGSAALLLEDFELMADAENLELMQDVEFYAWLDSAPDLGDSG